MGLTTKNLCKWLYPLNIFESASLHHAVANPVAASYCIRCQLAIRSTLRRTTSYILAAVLGRADHPRAEDMEPTSVPQQA
eukprot:1291708-Amphidinium_carterae.1